MQEIFQVGGEGAALLAALHFECFDVEERWSAEVFAQLLSIKGTVGWVAYDGDEPAGLLVVRDIVGEYEVLTFGVRAALRGRGIGRSLMKFFLNNTVSKESVIFLEVKKSNNVALTLYASLGFRQVGYRKRYYPDGEDACVLSFSGE